MAFDRTTLSYWHARSGGVQQLLNHEREQEQDHHLISSDLTRQLEEVRSKALSLQSKIHQWLAWSGETLRRREDHTPGYSTLALAENLPHDHLIGRVWFPPAVANQDVKEAFFQPCKRHNRILKDTSREIKSLLLALDTKM